MEAKITKDNMNAQAQAKNADVGNTDQKESGNVPENVPDEKATAEERLLKEEMGHYTISEHQMNDESGEDGDENTIVIVGTTVDQFLEDAVRVAIEENKSGAMEEAGDNAKEELSTEKDETEETDATIAENDEEAANLEAVDAEQLAARSHVWRLLLFIFFQMLIVCVCSVYSDELYEVVDRYEIAMAASFGVDLTSTILTIVYVLGAFGQLYLTWMLQGRFNR